VDLTFDFPTLLHNILGLLVYDSARPMLFSSGLFWGIFIIFLPIYALLRSRRKKMMIFVILFSLYFYYKSSGWFFLLIVVTSLIDWILARQIERETSQKKRRLFLVISLCCSLAVLFFFKYTNFFIWNINAIVSSNFQPLDILLPVGISYYTFKSISYVSDVYNRKMRPAESWIDYIFYLTFFPALVAGPIVRADFFLPQIHENKAVTKEQIYGGFWLIILGIVKKAVVADYISQYNDLVFNNPGGYGGVELLMAVFGYTMQIYCDFSGYSDMAIGIGHVMGFDLGINFNFPYRSLNITEFWRRWHISLSTWLRDYIYIPLGGNRKGKWRQYLNLMITMFLGGMWHGAAWRFIFWGVGHGSALCIHKMLREPLKRIPDNFATKFIAWFITFTFISTMWIFFRANSFTDAWLIITNVFAKFDPQHLLEFITVRYMWCILTGVFFLLHFLPQKFYDSLRKIFINSFWVFKLIIFIIIIQLVLEFSAADVQPFIYFQF
jgi:alginate O-acetyltransferase complex protein AlgI